MVRAVNAAPSVLIDKKTRHTSVIKLDTMYKGRYMKTQISIISEKVA